MSGLESELMAGRASVTLPTPDDDIAAATVALLYNLNLLPTRADLARAGQGTLSGPPQSVALIEAGATSVAKWWAAGAGVSFIGIWTAVKGFWADNGDLHAVMLWCAALTSAALILAIAHLLSSDVRGRADAMVETIRTRGEVARAMLEAARSTSAAVAAPPHGLLPSIAAHNGSSFERAESALN